MHFIFVRNCKNVFWFNFQVWWAPSNAARRARQDQSASTWKRRIENGGKKFNKKVKHYFKVLNNEITVDKIKMYLRFLDDKLISKIRIIKNHRPKKLLETLFKFRCFLMNFFFIKLHFFCSGSKNSRQSPSRLLAPSDSIWTRVWRRDRRQ